MRASSSSVMGGLLGSDKAAASISAIGHRVEAAKASGLILGRFFGSSVKRAIHLPLCCIATPGRNDSSRFATDRVDHGQQPPFDEPNHLQAGFALIKAANVQVHRLWIEKHSGRVGNSTLCLARLLNALASSHSKRGLPAIYTEFPYSCPTLSGSVHAP